MNRFEEFQVKCYGREWPESSMVEIAEYLEQFGESEEPAEVAEALGEMMVHIAKWADKIGYTLGEVCDYER